MLAANTTAKDHTFWSAELPFAAASAFAGMRLVGRQPVSDVYLLGLAFHRGGMLATLDQRISALVEPKSAGRKALEIIS